MELLIPVIILSIIGIVIILLTILGHLSHLNKLLKHIDSSISQSFAHQIDLERKLKNKEKIEKDSSPLTEKVDAMTSAIASESVKPSLKRDPSFPFAAPGPVSEPVFLLETISSEPQQEPPLYSLNLEEILNAPNKPIFEKKAVSSSPLVSVVPTPARSLTIEPKKEDSPEASMISKDIPIHKPVMNIPFEKSLRPSAKPTASGPVAAYLKNVWSRTWRWIVYGREIIPEGASMEALIATAWLMRAAVVLILFFLGYLIRVTQLDAYFRSGYGRTAIAALLGLGLIYFGLKKIKGDYQLIAQGLCGSGIAALYFAIYSIMSKSLLVPYFEESSSRPLLIALALMMGVSLWSGILALRHNAMFMAAAALAGGLITPFFASPSHALTHGTYLYFVFLTLGLCVIAAKKRWPFLNLLALLGFAIVYLLRLAPVVDDPSSVKAALGMVGVIGALFTLLPLLSAGKLKNLSSSFDLLVLTSGTFLAVTEGVVLVCRLPIDDAMKWSALVPAGFCLLFLIQLGWAMASKLPDRALITTWLALTAGLAALIPSLLFAHSWWGMNWAILAVLLFFLSYKVNSAVLRILASIITSITLLHLCFIGFPYMTLDLIRATRTTYFNDLVNHLFMIGAPLLSLWMIARMEARPPKMVSMDFAETEKRNCPKWIKRFVYLMGIVALMGFFIAVNIQVWFGCELFFNPACYPALTWVWIGFAFILYRCFKIPYTRLFWPLLSVLALKFLIFDWLEWHCGVNGIFHSTNLTDPGYFSHYTRFLIPRIADFTALASVLLYTLHTLKEGHSKTIRGIKSACVILLTTLMLLWTTCEVSTLMHCFAPEVRALGISVLWSFFAIGFVARGLLTQRKTFRIFGLIMFAIVTLKILAHDLWNEAGLLRIAALAVLILLYIAATALYIRISLPKNNKPETAERKD